MTWKIALPMYNVSAAVRDGYENLALTLVDRLRAEGWRDAVELVRDTGDLVQFWSRPDLLLSQTCGYPYMTQLRGHVQLLATPRYDFPGCDGADYSSAIVTRLASGFRKLDDARGCIAAVNDAQSNSGMNLLRHAIALLTPDGAFFAGVTVSGGHAASLALLRERKADLAAIDCVTLAYVKAAHPEWLEGLAVMQYSVPSPGLPFIASGALAQDWVVRLRAALVEPQGDMAQSMRALHIDGFTHRGDDDYAQILQLEQAAKNLGYPVLR